MRELDKISASLFEKIRAQFDHVSLGNDKANRTSDPERARFINFDYVGRDGENYGNVTLSFIDEDNLKVYFGSNITQALSETQEAEWYGFLKELRMFAKRNLLNFDVRDINRSNLDVKQLKQQSASDDTHNTDDLNLGESKLYGDNRDKHTSYANLGEHKIIIKHVESIDPDKHGARARNISKVFIETPVGERFLLDHKNLHGARALANHLNRGGEINDNGSTLINEMVKEMSAMRHFARSMNNRTFEDTETTRMVEAALGRYAQVRKQLESFKGTKGHALLLQMSEEYTAPEDDVDVDELRERFVKKIFDDRLNDALPYVQRAYTSQFEDWATDMTEETFGPAGTDELTQLFDEPLTVGMDGQDAIAAMAGIGIVDNDDLSAQLQDLSKQGPDVDARPMIAAWLAQNGQEDLSQELEAILQSQAVNTTAPAPRPQEPDNDTYGATTMPAGNGDPVMNEFQGTEIDHKIHGLTKQIDISTPKTEKLAKELDARNKDSKNLKRVQDIITKESADDLDMIRWLSGLDKK